MSAIKLSDQLLRAAEVSKRLNVVAYEGNLVFQKFSTSLFTDLYINYDEVISEVFGGIDLVDNNKQLS